MVLFSLLICLRKKIGAGVVRTSCFLRYNTSIFYDPSTPALSPLPQGTITISIFESIISTFTTRDK
ncbi:hypothetical protein AAHE18_09G180400 [Arachis hypogaea]